MGGEIHPLSPLQANGYVALSPGFDVQVRICSILEPTKEDSCTLLQPLYALPQLTVFWGSVTQLRYSSEYQRNRNDRYFCVSQSIAISDNVNWFSKLGYFFIYSLNECFEEKKVSFLIIFLVRTDYIFWDIFGASLF